MENNLFRIPISIPKADNPIETKDKILFIGSCFAGNMGQFMEEARFPVMVNPFGVLYNPMSVAWTIDSMLKQVDAGDLELVYNNGLWHSFFHHGKFSYPTPCETVEKINGAINKAGLFLKEADYLILTFGTSYVYEHKKKLHIVANCHKFADNLFNRYLLEPEDIIETYTDLIVQLRVNNPGLKIILTVSPIRHLKDGAHGNQISKSVLLLAIEKLISRFDGISYFPAYEIVLDELRDYRFYDSGMTKPNNVAVKYIWERFVDTFFSEEAVDYNNRVQKIIKARNHRPVSAESDDFKNFINNVLKQIETLTSQFPCVLLKQDTEYFLNLLKTKD